MANWAPHTLKEGDIVEHPYKPAWGKGVVLKTELSGIITFPDSTSVQYQRPTGEQRVSVRFTDGRTRTIFTSTDPLRVVEGP